MVLRRWVGHSMAKHAMVQVRIRAIVTSTSLTIYSAKLRGTESTPPYSRPSSFQRWTRSVRPSPRSTIATTSHTSFPLLATMRLPRSRGRSSAPGSNSCLNSPTPTRSVQLASSALSTLPSSCTPTVRRNGSHCPACSHTSHLSWSLTKTRSRRCSVTPSGAALSSSYTSPHSTLPANAEGTEFADTVIQLLFEMVIERCGRNRGADRRGARVTSSMKTRNRPRSRSKQRRRGQNWPISESAAYHPPAWFEEVSGLPPLSYHVVRLWALWHA